MDELIVQGEISSHILTLRGKQVMLDRDLAELYQVKATRLREQVKRNRRRFPDDFMFQLNENEVEAMVSQNAIPSKQHLGWCITLCFYGTGCVYVSYCFKK